jgi:pimeloyl-ACP methyl ester carboxylesterase
MRTVSSRDGTTIAYDQQGNGPVVILVGGAMSTRSGPWWEQLVELLGKDFTIISYDRRGRGDSGDTAPYAVEREVEDLEALITAAGGPASLFGMSSGAVLALHAGASGLNIEKLALYEPPFIVGSNGPRPPEDAVKQLTELASSGRRGEAVEFFMTQVMGIPAGFVAQMKHTPMWPGLEAVAHTLAYDITIMGDWSLPHRLASVTIPTLAIDGENSPALLRDAVQAVADTLPNARRRTLEGQTHDVSMEALAPVLAEFFAE